jgi:hypothetical protein
MSMAMITMKDSDVYNDKSDDDNNNDDDDDEDNNNYDGIHVNGDDHNE